MLKHGVIAIKAPLGRAVESQSAQVGDCRLDPVVASPLDREGAYLSGLVVASPLDREGAYLSGLVAELGPDRDWSRGLDPRQIPGRNGF